MSLDSRPLRGFMSQAQSFSEYWRMMTGVCTQQNWWPTGVPNRLQNTVSSRIHQMISKIRLWKFTIFQKKPWRSLHQRQPLVDLVDLKRGQCCCENLSSSFSNNPVLVSMRTGLRTEHLWTSSCVASCCRAEQDAPILQSVTVCVEHEDHPTASLLNYTYSIPGSNGLLWTSEETWRGSCLMTEQNRS